MLILSLHKSPVSTTVCCESKLHPYCRQCYISAAAVGMIPLCHNSWPKCRILLVKVLRPHLVFHFAHCPYNGVFYDPVSQQTMCSILAFLPKIDLWRAKAGSEHSWSLPTFCRPFSSSRSPQNSLCPQWVSGSCFPLLREVTTFYFFLYFLGYSAYLYQVQLYVWKLRVHTYVSQLTFG